MRDAIDTTITIKALLGYLNHTYQMVCVPHRHVSHGDIESGIRAEGVLPFG